MKELKFIASLLVIVLIVYACGQNKTTDQKSSNEESKTEKKEESKSFEFTNRKKGDGTGSATFEINGHKYAYAYNVQDDGNIGVMFSEDLSLKDGLGMVCLTINDIEGYEAIDTHTPVNELMEPYQKTMFKIRGKSKTFYYRPVYAKGGVDGIGGFVYSTK